MAQISAGQVYQVLTAQGTVNGVVEVVRTTGFVVGAKVSINRVGVAGVEARIVSITNATQMILRDANLPAAASGSDMSTFLSGASVLQPPQTVNEVAPLLASTSPQPPTNIFPSTYQVAAYSALLTADGSNGYIQVATPERFMVGVDVTLTSTAPLTAIHLKVTSIVNDRLYLLDTATGLPFDASTYHVLDNADVTQTSQYLFFNEDYDARNPPMNEYEMMLLNSAIYPSGALFTPSTFGNAMPPDGAAIGARVINPLVPPAYVVGTLQNLTVDTTGALRIQGNFTATFSGATTPSDAFVNPVDAINSASFLMGWDSVNSEWERVRSTGGILDTNVVSQALSVDRQVSGSITNVQTVTLDTQGTGGCKLHVTGAWTGSLTIEQSVDGVNYVPYGVFPLPTSRGLPLSSTITSNGLYMFNGSGAMYVRVRGNTVTGGQADCAFDAGSSPALITANLIDDGVVLTAMGTSTPLGIGGVWTSPVMDVTAFASLSVFIVSDVPSAALGFKAFWSADGTNFYAATGGKYNDQGDHSHVTLSRRARYLKLEYTNGAIGQASFTLQTIGQKITPLNTQVLMGERLDDLDVGLLARSVITGKSLDSADVYANANVTAEDVGAGPGIVGLVTRNISPAYSLSAFGEQRVSIPYTLFDMNNKYGRDSRVTDAQVVGGGTVANLLVESAVRLQVTGAINDAARMRTHQWFQYQAGRGMRATLTIIHGDTGQVNQVRNWGLYSDTDGLMFRLTGSNLSIVRRTSTGEGGGTIVAPFEVVTTQANWNHDTMDGNGPSGIVLDITKGNIYEIQYQWLGVGVVQFFVDGSLVHVISNPNTLAYAYMASGGSLPMTWEVTNTGASVGALMKVVCANVTSQSGEDPPEFGFSYERNAGVAMTNVEIPALAMRVSSLYNTLDNRALLFPVAVEADNTTAAVMTVRVYLNPTTLTGATWAGVVPTLCGTEVDIAATAFTGGELLARDSAAAAVGGGGSTGMTVGKVRIDLKDIFKRNARVFKRLAFSGASDVLLVTVQGSVAGPNTVFPGVQWKTVP